MLCRATVGATTPHRSGGLAETRPRTAVFTTHAPAVAAQPVVVAPAVMIVPVEVAVAQDIIHRKFRGNLRGAPPALRAPTRV